MAQMLPMSIGLQVWFSCNDLIFIGQPINSNNPMCISNQNGKWYSSNCNDPLPYICKIDVTIAESCATCDDGWTFSAVTGKCYMVNCLNSKNFKFSL